MNATIKYLGKYTHRLRDGDTFHHLLLIADRTAYVLNWLVNSEGDGTGRLYTDSNALVYTDCSEMEMAMEISKNRGDAEKIIACERINLEYESHQRTSALLKIDGSFCGMSDDEVQKIEDLINGHSQAIKDEIRRFRKYKARRNEAANLISTFRYQDAREHCQIFELDYQDLLDQHVKWLNR